MQREEILASRARRSKQLESLLDDSKQRLADHRSGTRILNEKERKDLENKINIYQRKLDSMKGELDEREIERLIKRERLHQERLQERRARERDRDRSREL
jgi:hypothetical protein